MGNATISPRAGWVAVGVTGCLLSAAGAWAELLLSLDARQPGASPGSQWEDLSGNNAPFTSNGNPVHNAGSGIYTFSRNGLFTGNVANESLYDFDTDVAGPGQGDPYTVVIYAGIEGNQGREGMINKLDSAGGNSTGWHTGLSQDEFGLNNVFTEQRVQNGNRAIIRTPGSAADPPPNTLSGIGVTASVLNLYVLHISGSGSGSAQADVYINGGTAQAAETVFPFETLNSGSILNNDPLRIGGQLAHIAISKGFVGDIRFIEIWSGATAKDMSPADYSAWRFANLAVVMGNPPLGAPVPHETFSVDLFTEEGVTYRLESTTGITGGSWVDTGARLVGNGQVMTFHDPSGVSVHMIYRVGVE